MDAPGRPGGDASRLDEVRVTHEQNLVLPHVPLDDRAGGLSRGWTSIGLATANLALISDIIACPGLDYCALANARSIPIAQDIAAALRRARTAPRTVGELKIEDLRLHQRLRPPPHRPHRHPGRR